MSETIDLVEKIRIGDKDAERSLVSSYWRKLYFILYKRSSDPELAADLTQETFIIVINKARNGEILNPSALSAFIRQVGINLLIADYRRTNARKTDSYAELDDVFDATKDEVLSKLSSQKLGEQVMQLMEELPVQRDRDLLIRHFVHAQTKAAICQELDLSPANFDRVLHRARSRLKQILLVKTGLDLETQSITHLLSIALLSCLVMQGAQLPHSFNRPTMGESDSSTHLRDIDKMYSAQAPLRGLNDRI